MDRKVSRQVIHTRARFHQLCRLVQGRRVTSRHLDALAIVSFESRGTCCRPTPSSSPSARGCRSCARARGMEPGRAPRRTHRWCELRVRSRWRSRYSAPSDRGLSLPMPPLYVVSVAVAGHIRIDVGSGFTVPTQAVFVPMLFAAAGRAGAAAGGALAGARECSRRCSGGSVSPRRLLTAPANSWFALGPAVVLAARPRLQPRRRARRAARARCWRSSPGTSPRARSGSGCAAGISLARARQ